LSKVLNITDLIETGALSASPEVKGVQEFPNGELAHRRGRSP